MTNYAVHLEASTQYLHSRRTISFAEELLSDLIAFMYFLQTLICGIREDFPDGVVPPVVWNISDEEGNHITDPMVVPA